MSDNFVNFQNASIKAYDTNNNMSVVNVSRGISTTYNGFGSFLLDYRDFRIYFLEIPVDSNLVYLADQPFNADKTSM